MLCIATCGAVCNALHYKCTAKMHWSQRQPVSNLPSPSIQDCCRCSLRKQGNRLVPPSTGCMCSTACRLPCVNAASALSALRCATCAALALLLPQDAETVLAGLPAAPLGRVGETVKSTAGGHCPYKGCTLRPAKEGCTCTGREQQHSKLSCSVLCSKVADHTLVHAASSNGFAKLQRWWDILP
jgi:hypothetical protein